MFRRFSCGSEASCGATTEGSTINVGSRFFAGSGSGGANCLSAALGSLPSDGGVSLCLPPPPPPLDSSLAGRTSRLGAYRAMLMTPLGSRFGGGRNGISASATIIPWTSTDNRRGTLALCFDHISGTSTGVAVSGPRLLRNSERSLLEKADPDARIHSTFPRPACYQPRHDSRISGSIFVEYCHIGTMFVPCPYQSAVANYCGDNVERVHSRSR